ncbi:MAG: efflux RND transporter periplasmic adaptor subunit [Magnetovibrionaceae bacterium]
MPVTVAKPAKKKVVDWDEYTGRFEAMNRVEIRARVSGFLDSVNFGEGEVVEEGQLLFVIDPRPFEAELAVAQAGLEGARTRLNLADRELKRGEQLLKRNTISREQVDERRAARETARTEVLGAQAEVRIAELNLEFTQVRAPFTGRISDARVDVGNLVAGGSAQSTVLTTLVSTNPILFTFTASEAEFLKYSRLSSAGHRASSRTTAHPVELRLMDEEGWPHKGTMDFVDNELSPETATIRAKAIFPNPDEFLTPGVFGRLRVGASSAYEALLIPDAAVLSDQNRKIVLTADADGQVSAKPVTLGPLHDGLRVVRSGLTFEDLVIVRGVQRARPGGSVVPTEMKLKSDGTLEPLAGS